jgi:hypothetical protein
MVRSRSAPADHHANRSLVAEILAGRRSRLDRRGHLGEFLLLFSFRKRPNLFFKHSLGGSNAFHNLAIQQAAHGADVRGLRMILEPYRLGKSAPSERKLSLQTAGNHHVEAARTRPRLVSVLLQIIRFRLYDGEDRLGGTKRRNAFKHGYGFECVNSSRFQTEPGRSITHRTHEGSRGRGHKPPSGKLFPQFSASSRARPAATDVDVVAARVKAASITRGPL